MMSDPKTPSDHFFSPNQPQNPLLNNSQNPPPFVNNPQNMPLQNYFQNDPPPIYYPQDLYSLQNAPIYTNFTQTNQPSTNIPQFLPHQNYITVPASYAQSPSPHTNNTPANPPSANFLQYLPPHNYYSILPNYTPSLPTPINFPQDRLPTTSYYYISQSFVTPLPCMSPINNPNSNSDENSLGPLITPVVMICSALLNSLPNLIPSDHQSSIGMPAGQQQIPQIVIGYMQPTTRIPHWYPFFLGPQPMNQEDPNIRPDQPHQNNHHSLIYSYGIQENRQSEVRVLVRPIAVVPSFTTLNSQPKNQEAINIRSDQSNQSNRNSMQHSLNQPPFLQGSMSQENRQSEVRVSVHPSAVVSSVSTLNSQPRNQEDSNIRSDHSHQNNHNPILHPLNQPSFLPESISQENGQSEVRVPVRPTAVVTPISVLNSQSRNQEEPNMRPVHPIQNIYNTHYSTHRPPLFLDNLFLRNSSRERGSRSHAVPSSRPRDQTEDQHMRLNQPNQSPSPNNQPPYTMRYMDRRQNEIQMIPNSNFSFTATILMNRNTSRNRINAHNREELSSDPDYLSNFLTEHAGTENEECFICLSNGEKLWALQCKHECHKECLLKWFKIKKICPLCRAPINKDK